jgi:hypothetical protein
MVESCCFVAGNFQALRFAPMFTGTWLESEIGSSFLWFALFGSGYPGLGLLS